MLDKALLAPPQPLVSQSALCKARYRPARLPDGPAAMVPRRLSSQPFGRSPETETTPSKSVCIARKYRTYLNPKAHCERIPPKHETSVSLRSRLGVEVTRNNYPKLQTRRSERPWMCKLVKCNAFLFFSQSSTSHRT